MEEQQYPERLPESIPFEETFSFSLSVGREQKRDLELRIEALETRISRLVDKMQRVTGDLPIFAQLLNFIKGADELEIIGKALVKVSPMIRELNTYRRRHDAFLLAEEEPDFFRWGFGDFSKSFDLDNVLGTYLSNGETDKNTVDHESTTNFSDDL